MKLVTFEREAGREELGILLEKRVLPLEELGFAYRDMNELIERADREELARMAAAEGEGLPLEDIRLLSPIPRPRQDVLCLGLNYSEHAREAAGYSSDAFGGQAPEPIFFSKRVSYSQGPGAPIPAHRELTERLDYENELAVILGKDARDVAPEQAAEYVFGYTVLNDVSARDVQTRHKQWYFGKSLDGFTPMGPCIVTADEIPFPPQLGIRTFVNGEKRQDSNTGLLIHDIPEIISTLSRGMTLLAGTIIATGTPKGVIMGMEDPHFLQPGDVVRCEIQGIGALENPVTD